MFLLELFTSAKTSDWERVYDDPDEVHIRFRIGEGKEQYTFIVMGMEQPIGEPLASINEMELLDHLNDQGIEKWWWWEFADQYGELKKTDVFKRGGSKGLQFKVFANVIGIIRREMKRNGGRALAFGADKFEESRVKLYLRMAQTLAKREGWNLQVVDDFGEVVLILWK